MTTKSDWAFRADFLKQQAEYLRKKAYEFECEAARYDGLADQAHYLANVEETART